MNSDLIRIIDGICREKNIDRDSFVADLENAMTSAIRKAHGDIEDVVVTLDPLGGGITATVEGNPVDVHMLGRIAAQTAKQVIIQRTRERERTSILEEFTERRGTIVTGTVVRAEGGNLLVNIGRCEGFLPRSEQIPGETHAVGGRIRVLILDVREQGNQVRVILSRSHPDFIHRLFELEVPEVAERIIEIRALAREAGYRSKVAVSSIDSKVDAVGACVGVRGSRIRNIVDELSGEKIDIVRWNESSQILIQNALKPAEVQEIALCFELGKATVVVTEDQLSLAIGKRGQNVRLAARLTKWAIDIITPTEYNKHLELLEQTVKGVPGVDDVVVDKLVAIGIVSVSDLDEVGPDPLTGVLELDPELAEQILIAAGEEAIHQEELKEEAAKQEAEARVRQAALGPDAVSEPSGFIPSDSETSGEAGGEVTETAEAGAMATPPPGLDAEQVGAAEEAVGAQTAEPEGLPADEEAAEFAGASSDQPVAATGEQAAVIDEAALEEAASAAAAEAASEDEDRPVGDIPAMPGGEQSAEELAEGAEGADEAPDEAPDEPR